MFDLTFLKRYHMFLVICISIDRAMWSAMNVEINREVNIEFYATNFHFIGELKLVRITDADAKIDESQ
jgi:hypothetical protein